METADITSSALAAPVTSFKFVQMSEAFKTYFYQKGKGRKVIIHRPAERACDYFFDAGGDRHFELRTEADAKACRDALIYRGLEVSSLTRAIGTVRAVTNFAASEQVLTLKSRLPGSVLAGQLVCQIITRSPDAPEVVHEQCREFDGELRKIRDLVSDAGMCLAEATKLSRGDVITEGGLHTATVVNQRN